MDGSSPKARIEDILTAVEAYRPDMDEGLLRQAYVFAANRHRGQLRLSGEPYLSHPLHVAKILTGLELDEVAVATGMLHDILEDTDTTRSELEAVFGGQIAGLVAALTKIATFESTFAARQASEAESFRRLLLASVDDVRVILVKLADRLHNMRTLEYLERSRQLAIAQETLEIYAPIANRLGIGAMKEQLQDLCFRFLEPQQHEHLQTEVAERNEAAHRWFREIQATVQELLQRHGIQARVVGRIKHMYSIWDKLQRQNVDVTSVFDLLAFRVVVDTVADCYAILGLIHQLWSPVPGRIKDYIAIPKPNGYQSLHTSVVGPEGQPFEIQIRTHEMHRLAEYGIAAHWSYKEQGSEHGADDSRVTWLRGILDQTEGSTPREFLDTLRLDLYPDEVYSFTPAGQVLAFPRGATVLDFAYKVHTEVGHQCAGARLSGRWVPIRTELRNGDIVEIVTSQNQRPSRGWLDLVVTSRARTKIRAWLKREEKRRAVEIGRRLLDRELRRAGSSLKAFLTSQDLEATLHGHGYSREEDLCAAIGFGRLAAAQLAGQFVAVGEERARTDDDVDSAGAPPATGAPPLEVTGESDFLAYLARCCSPVPGEEIVGFVTRGKGVAVHSRWCPNVRQLREHPERGIEVAWADSALATGNGRSRVGLRVRYDDLGGMLGAICSVIEEARATIVSCQQRSLKEGAAASIVIEVSEAAHLRRVLANLEHIQGVVSVNRQGGTRR
jgi:GTP pyrophosphokinase